MRPTTFGRGSLARLLLAGPGAGLVCWSAGAGVVAAASIVRHPLPASGQGGGRGAGVDPVPIVPPLWPKVSSGALGYPPALSTVAADAPPSAAGRLDPPGLAVAFGSEPRGALRDALASARLERPAPRRPGEGNRHLPEPASILLLVTGLTGWLVRRQLLRRRG